MWRKILLFTCVLLTSLVVSPVVYGQASPPKHVSLVLAIDSSGSMNENDPNPPVGNPLRVVSAKLLVSMLDIGDEVGLVEFGSQVYLKMPLQRIQSDADKERVFEALNGIKTRDGDGTDIRGAIRKAGDFLGSADSKNARYIVLLTDGKPTIKDPQAPDLTPGDAAKRAAADVSIPILAVGLSPNANIRFLNDVTAIVAGGKAFPVANANGLPDAYLDIFGRLTDRIVAMTEQDRVAGSDQTAAGLNTMELLKPGGKAGEYVLKLPTATQAVTFALIKSGAGCNKAECLSIIGPDGTKYPAGNGVGKFYAEADFAVYTHQLPMAGEWRISAPRGGILRAILKPQLRLRIGTLTDWLAAGQELTIHAQLYEERDDTIVTLAGRSGRVIKVYAQRVGDAEAKLIELRDDGANGDAVAGDGDFTAVYSPSGPGSYTLTFQTDDVLSRVLQQRTLVVDACPLPVVTGLPSGATINASPGESIKFTVALPISAGSGTSAQLEDVTVTATRADGKPVSVATTPVDGVFLASFTAEPPSTEVTLSVTANVLCDGHPLAVTLQPQRYQFEIKSAVSHDLSVADFGIGYSLDSLQPVRMMVSAQSATPVTLRATLPGWPWAAVEVSPESVPPGSATMVELRLKLKPNAQLPGPGVYSGQSLILDAGPGVELTPKREVDARFELVQGDVSFLFDGGSADFGKDFAEGSFSPVAFVAQAQTAERLKLTVAIRNLPWLRAHLDLETLEPGTAKSFKVVPELIENPPALGKAYTGTLIIGAQAFGGVTKTPPYEVPVRIEVLQPKIELRNLDHAKLGVVDKLSDLPTREPLRFYAESSLPVGLPLSAKIVDASGKEIESLRAIVTPDKILPNNGTNVSLSIEPTDPSAGRRFVGGRAFNGKVVFSAQTPKGFPVTITPGAVDFRLQERSEVGYRVQRFGETVINLLLGGISLLVLYALASLIWVFVRYQKGALRQGGLDPVVEEAGRYERAGASRYLASWNTWRNRVFGVALSADKDGRTPTVYANWLEKLLACPWAAIAKPEKTDFDLPNRTDDDDGMDPASGIKPRSDRARLLARNGDVYLVNLDEKASAMILTPLNGSADDGPTTFRESTARTNVEFKLKGSEILCLKGVNLRYRNR